MKIQSGGIIEQLLAIFAVIVLIGGSMLVLAPFTVALLWAAILSYSTWTPYQRLCGLLGGRCNLAASIIVLAILMILFLPFLFGGFGLAANAHAISIYIHELTEKGFPALPAWIVRLPFAGDYLQTIWSGLSQGDSEVIGQIKKLAAPLGKVALNVGVAIGQGVGVLALSVILAFFFYTGGEHAVKWLRIGMLRIAGERADHLLKLTGNTIKGVVFGILGTALAQAVLAAIGFGVAGVPYAVILGLVTFFVSILPGGAMLIWVPAAIWLFQSGEVGWSIFLTAWGLLVIGSADNVIKPLLISKGSDMPFILVMLGALGGALAFGFMGVFIGPTLLAVAYTVLRDWTVGSVISPEIETVSATMGENREQVIEPVVGGEVGTDLPKPVI
jgi:predicted PurR-regulated permease PerM